MIPSIRGHQLPESEAEFTLLRSKHQNRFWKCYACDKPFTCEIVKTSAGWKETQISGMCEVCYDELFSDAQDSGVDQL